MGEQAPQIPPRCNATEQASTPQTPQGSPLPQAKERRNVGWLSMEVQGKQASLQFVASRKVPGDSGSEHPPRSSVAEGLPLLSERNKDIKSADRDGWDTVDLYVNDPLAIERRKKPNGWGKQKKEKESRPQRSRQFGNSTFATERRDGGASTSVPEATNQSALLNSHRHPAGSIPFDASAAKNLITTRKTAQRLSEINELNNPAPQVTERDDHRLSFMPNKFPCDDVPDALSGVLRGDGKDDARCNIDDLPESDIRAEIDQDRISCSVPNRVKKSLQFWKNIGSSR